MSNLMRLTVSCLCLVMYSANTSFAKEWHGIIPLHSTRADVLRILGKSTIGNDLYDVEEGRANIMYVRRRCQQGLPADWGNWDVAPDTVVNISISLKSPIPVAELKIP